MLKMMSGSRICATPCARRRSMVNHKSKLHVLTVLGALALVTIMLMAGCANKDPNKLSKLSSSMVDIKNPTTPEEIDELEIPGFVDANSGTEGGTAAGELALPYALGDSGLSITRLGSYTGRFVEDGSDTLCFDTLMIVVTNNSENDVQYMKLHLESESDKYEFNLTSLPAGKSVMVLEASCKKFDTQERYAFGAVDSYALYQEERSLHDDIFVIKGADGKLVVKNKSKTDITGSIYIYYKTADVGIYIGGITYRAKIDGLAAGEEKEIETSHYLKNSSKVLFVTFANE